MSILAKVSSHADVIIATASFFVAAASWIVSYQTLKIQHKHNVLSVKPIPQFSIGDYENELFVKLKNYGIGPLIVEKFVAEMENGELKSKIIDALPTALRQQVRWETFTGVVDGYALAPEKEFVLLKASFDVGSTPIHNSLRSELSKLQLKVEVKDIYGNLQPIYEKSLDWFARTLNQPLVRG